MSYMWLIAQIIFVFAGWGLFPFIYKAIQPGQMLGWWTSHVVDKLYAKGHNNLSKFLGDCEVCFAHFFAWVLFGLSIASTWAIWPITISALGWGGYIANYLFACCFIGISWRVNLMGLNWYKKNYD